jgi:hypothetical protein
MVAVYFRRAYMLWAVFASCAPLAAACSALTSLDGLSGGGGAFERDAATVGGDGAGDSFSDGGPVGDDEGTDAGLGPGADAGHGDASLDASGNSPDVGAPIVCGDGGLVCNGACIDPASDPKNCNGCGNVCSSGLCGTSLAASMTSSPAGWLFNGTAVYNSFAPSAQLTAAGVTDQAGTFVYANAVKVDSMTVQFEFRIGLEGGTRSDGMGFMIEQSGATAVGGIGSSLGMAGLTGFGVELDIYDNAICGDTSGDHVGVDDLAICDQSEGTPTSLSEVDVTSTVDLGDTHWHTAIVAIDAGAVTLTIDGNVALTDVPLTGFQATAPYYIGFAGATGGLVLPDGGGGYRQEVKNVLVTFATARCL